MKDLKLEKFTMSNWAKVHNFNSQANSMDAHICIFWKWNLSSLFFITTPQYFQKCKMLIENALLKKSFTGSWCVEQEVGQLKMNQKNNDVSYFRLCVRIELGGPWDIWGRSRSSYNRELIWPEGGAAHTLQLAQYWMYPYN